MQHRNSSRQANTIYGATSRQHHPYPQTSRSPSHTFSLLAPTSCEDLFDRDQCYPDCSQPSSPEERLQNTLYIGSASSLISTAYNQHTSAKHFNLMSMGSHHNDRSSSQGHYPPTTPILGSMPSPLMHSSSQPSFGSVSNSGPSNGVGGRNKSMKRSQGSPTKRPTPEEFQNLVLFPREYDSVIFDYVGTDAKYTLAKNHAGMMVRSSIKSQDMASRMREVVQPLDAIDLFLMFLLEYQPLKPEQKGCMSLRICFGALAALLGDFSQGTSVENFASDPQAPVISREHLGQFRSFNPELHQILYRLSAKLEKSMNLYRHRRSPSASLVAKFQEMSDTLEVWNKHLKDDTFAAPSKIASDWLRNHPTQVEGRRRNQAYSEQTSPSLSDTTRTSPIQCDSNYHSPTNGYGEPSSSRPPNTGNVRSVGLDGPNQCESLFRSPSGVTYFSSNSMVPGSVIFNPDLFRFGESMNLPPLTDGQVMFTHQGHPANTGQYNTNGPAFPGF